MNGIQLTVSVSVFGGLIFACGVLFNKVNNHDKRLTAGDTKLDIHSEAVAKMDTSIENIKEDVQEIKTDVKLILRNNK